MLTRQPIIRALLLTLLIPCVTQATETSSGLPSNHQKGGDSVNSAQFDPSLNTASDNLAEQRQLYSQALQLASQKQWKKLRQHRQLLEDYPLYPYLVYADLIADLRFARRQEVEAYLANYQFTVKAEQLRGLWLDYLARRGYWTAYVESYLEQSATVSQQCNFYLAQHRLNNRALAFKGGLRLWAAAESQPKACDKLFGILIKGGHISEQLAWQRFNGALLAHNYQLARYLKRFLTSPKYQQLHELYYSLERNPKQLRQPIELASNTPEELALIAHVINHLARKDPNLALRHWTRFKQTHEFSHNTEARIVSAIVKGLFKAKHYAAADSYLLDHLRLLNQSLEGELTEWRIRQSLATMNWTEVRQWLTRLPKTSQQKSLWRYWTIRSMESDPVTTRDPVLIQLTQSLAKERDFYGFLASERLGKEYSINHNPVTLDEPRRNRIAAIPAMQRARELHFHNEAIDANREWFQASKGFQTDDWLAAAVLASQWQWHNKAIASMGTAKYWDDIEIRFPLAFQTAINKAAKDAGIADYLLLALARQESAFNPHATSSAGAMGLVQVMPSTAKATARKHRLPYRSRKQLHDVSVNLALGATYYAELLARFDNNRILATAAYNAGPSRVDKWLKKSAGKLPFDVWMALIPYRETRSYVSNVMMYSVIYSRKLGIDPPMLMQREREMLL